MVWPFQQTDSAPAFICAPGEHSLYHLPLAVSSTPSTQRRRRRRRRRRFHTEIELEHRIRCIRTQANTTEPKLLSTWHPASIHSEHFLDVLDAFRISGHSYDVRNRTLIHYIASQLTFPVFFLLCSCCMQLPIRQDLLIKFAFAPI